MQLCVILSVVYCIYAVQANPQGGMKRDVGNRFDSMTTTELLGEFYNKLHTMMDHFTADETSTLRECLTEFVLDSEKRLFSNHTDIEKRIEDLKSKMSKLSLENLIDFAYVYQEKTLSISTKFKLKILRMVIVRFLKDTISSIVHRIKSIFWTTDFYRFDLTNKNFLKDWYIENADKMYELGDSIWVSEKPELIELLIRVIKHADEELVKCNNNKFEELIQRRPYKSLNTQSFRNLFDETHSRFDALLECYWINETMNYKTNIISMLQSINDWIVKYNSIE